jgi:hypothetical protein
MKLRVLVFAASALFAPAALAAPEPADQPVEVMIVASAHLANPGRDYHNLTVPDVLTPAAQAQLASMADALGRFEPTKVAVEREADVAKARYAQYLAGALPVSRGEDVQLGFRIARARGLDVVYGIDADGDFPFEAVDAYAKAHDQSAILDAANNDTVDMLATEQKIVDEKGVAALYRYLNDPARISRDNGFYAKMLRIGGGAEQPGVELLTAWHHRNFLICANLIQAAKPGDRILVIYGAGHAFLLRQCVQQTPGFRLVEPNDRLPD